MSIRTRDAREVRQYERQERERIEAPIKAALAEQEELLREKRQLELKAIQIGKPDSDFIIPEDALNLRMSVEEATKFSKASAAEFVKSTPEYYVCRENSGAITSYLLNNNIMIATPAAFRQAFERLNELGLLVDKPTGRNYVAEAEAIKASVNYDDPQSVKDGISRLEALKQEQEPEQEQAPETTAKEKYFSDVVLETEDGKTFTESDIDKLTADQFAALVKLKRVNRYSEMKRH